MLENLYRQIHHLATAYGWSETAILRLPRNRRKFYCELVMEDNRNASKWK